MTEDMRPEPEVPYGISKYAVEMDLAARRLFGLNYIVFRPHSGVRGRVRRGLRHAHLEELHLERLQHGPVPALRQLRDALRQISPLVRAGGSHLSPELMMLAIRSGLVCVEIPVHYEPRTGTSKITGSFWKAFRLGWKMIFLIAGYRFKSIPGAISTVRAVPPGPPARRA
jgi:hypothetical protein